MTDLQLPSGVRDRVLGVLRYTACDIRDEFGPDDDFSIMVMGAIADRDVPTHLALCSLIVQRFDAEAGELDDPWGRDITVPIIDWDGEHDATQPNGAIRVIVNDYVIPWLERHGITDDVELAGEVPWATGDIKRSAWRPLAEDG
jgi:hypothetical protein